MEFIKTNCKNILLMIAVFVICSVVKSYATEYLFSADEVNYNNSVSQMAANNVQDAVDELYSCATDYVALNNRIDAIEDGLENIDFSEIENQVSALSNKLYPVGSIYISVTDSTASAVHDKLGGTWVAFGQGRTLVGMGSNGTDSYSTVEDPNGSSTVTLVTDNLPAHSHTFSGTTESGGNHQHTVQDYYNGATIGNDHGGSRPLALNGYDWTGGNNFIATNWTGSHTHAFSGTTAQTGSGTSFSVMNPYITVYMWKRTA